ncbi:hypothetical protein CGL27_01420 [Streptomyces sp. 11-1-2]|nr:hypothetical protein CGL27_01420 [Streptomyces sp. 11-1-2]
MRRGTTQRATVNAVAAALRDRLEIPALPAPNQHPTSTRANTAGTGVESLVGAPDVEREGQGAALPSLLFMRPGAPTRACS